MLTPHITILEAWFGFGRGREEDEPGGMVRKAICEIFVVCVVKCFPPLGITKSPVNPTSYGLISPRDV